MEIRPYRAADLDAVIAIFLAAIRETAINDYTLAQVEAWAQADREAWATRRLSRPTWVACIGPAVQAVLPGESARARWHWRAGGRAA